MNTGENEQALRKIMDLTRLASVLILGVHFYYECYRFFAELGWQTELTDRILMNLMQTGLFSRFAYAKAMALVLLIVSLLGVKGKKQEKLRTKTAICYLLAGLLLFWCAGALFRFQLSSAVLTWCYSAATSIGFLLTLTGGVYLSRIIRVHLNDKDIFNHENETFPQEERLLENEYSINLPAEYYLKGKKRKSWINIINPFRGVLVMGTPGSGKSYFFIEHVIRQHIRKGFAMLVYDFKFDDLSRIAYNTWLQNQAAYKNPAKCYFIDFERIIHRCNPLEPASMNDITDAAEAARTILLGLNREWIKKQGDFFVESPINFLTAIIWYLRKYNDGEFCTLPHVIELMQVDYDRLFTILRTEKEIEALINPFVSAYLNDVMEQLEGQIAAAKISMARLVSPQLYYVMSGNDFTLDINNPEDPKIVCLGNNPQKQQVYGAVLSLYVSRLIKTVNKKGKLKCSLVFDEFPTIYLNNIDSLIATARSNLVATTLGIQDFSQLKKDYGKDQADVILNITGNVVSGQVNGETAKQLSERFGKIMQDRTSLSINRTDTSVSKSKQLDAAIPPSRISSLSSGAFVGMIADEPKQRIGLKSFHANILQPVLRQDIKESVVSDEKSGEKRPDELTIRSVYTQLKKEVEDLVDAEIERILADPILASGLIKK
ncbi:MAG: conjugal transfer protein TraG [Citrobacter freundii]|nr:MAG: conjugal transfer protein TraG [Citrobacter freundii]